MEASFRMKVAKLKTEVYRKDSILTVWEWHSRMPHFQANFTQDARDRATALPGGTAWALWLHARALYIMCSSQQFNFHLVFVSIQTTLQTRRRCSPSATSDLVSVHHCRSRTTAAGLFWHAGDIITHNGRIKDVWPSSATTMLRGHILLPWKKTKHVLLASAIVFISAAEGQSKEGKPQLSGCSSPVEWPCKPFFGAFVSLGPSPKSHWSAWTLRRHSRCWNHIRI